MLLVDLTDDEFDALELEADVVRTAAVTVARSVRKKMTASKRRECMMNKHMSHMGHLGHTL